MSRWLGSTLALLAAGSLGFWLGGGGRDSSGDSEGVLVDIAKRARHSALRATSRVADVDIRSQVLLEYPELIDRIRARGGFGGEFSRVVAQNMFGRLPEAIEDARALSKIVEVAPRTWLIRLPVVNAVLFETDEGLVLVDVGMAPGGPAIVDAIRSVSDAPLHTLIYTHGHVDHANGAWALSEAGEVPGQVIAHERLGARFERYIELRGSIGPYMSQPVEQLPAERDYYLWPTRTFSDRLELEIGGEEFILVHHPGETDDHLYVWVPGRRTLASGDYYQGFLPNAGNGKRVQRYVKEWIGALREMADLEPSLLLPAHGAEITSGPDIQRNFRLLADALEFIREHTLSALNRGLRKDEVFESLDWPAIYADDPTLEIQYVSPADISKMVIKRYTGWWDDVPSHWSPAPMVDRAEAILALSGGMEKFASFARETLKIDIRLACHLADWAFFADPDDPIAQQLVLDVYRARIMVPESNTQEILVYIDQMAAVRARQLGR